MRQRHGKGALHVAGLPGQVLKVTISYSAIAALERLRRAQLGVIQGLFIAAAESREEIRDLAGVHTRDGIYKCGEGNGAMSAIAKAALARGAVEHVNLGCRSDAEEIFYWNPIFKA